MSDNGGHGLGEPPCAPPVVENTSAAVPDHVQPATSVSTAETLDGASVTAKRSRGTKPPTPHCGEDGSATTESASASTSRSSRNCVKHSAASTPPWQTPSSIKALAAQANRVATLVLNNGIDLDTARAYSGLIRTVAQTVSIEVTRSRFLQTMPDLSLEEDVELDPREGAA